MQMISVERLRPHPKNGEYFGPLDAETREGLKADIAKRGIQVPLIATADLVLISGHQRLSIARELGLEVVPVVIRDVSEEEAEELLIVENLHRRHLSEMDRARLIRLLKERWGVRHGGDRKSSGDNCRLNAETGMAKVAAAFGLRERQARTLDRLNDLIPELQSLVGAGKLGVVAGEQLAYLTPEVQRQLYEVLGEELGQLKSEEVRRLRREIEAEVGASGDREREQLARRLAEAEAARAEAERKAGDLARLAEEAQKAVEAAQKRVQEAEEKAREAESRALRIAEEQAAAAKAAQEAAERGVVAANREVLQLQKAVKAKDEELKLAVEKAARLAQEKAAAESRALAAEKEAQSLRELYAAAGASEEQAVLAHEVAGRTAEFRQFLGGAIEVLKPEALTQDLQGHLLGEVRQAAALLARVEHKLTGAKPVNVVQFPNARRQGGEPG